MPQIDPEDRQAVFTIVGALVGLAVVLYAIDKSGIKFAVGVSS